jgi:uncharacterized protein (DUF2164 family)
MQPTCRIPTLAKLDLHPLDSYTPTFEPPRIMSIELSKESRNAAVLSIERYFQQNMEERIGNIQAAALLNFFLEEIGPSVYNKAVADAQERMQARVTELDIECHEDEFGYWQKQSSSGKKIARR